MIGKISSRKHKQWDSDGLLEVTEKNAVLKVFFNPVNLKYFKDYYIYKF